MLGFHPSLNRTARHRTVAAVLGGMVAMAACTSVGPPTRAAARFELTATGPLRAAFISGNRVQAARDPTSGVWTGPAITLARLLAVDLGVTLEIVPFTRAEDIVASVDQGTWDMAFLAIDPTRAAVLDFTAPYLDAHNGVIVAPKSGIERLDALDQPARRIGVGARDAVDLHLSRTLAHAVLVRNTDGLTGAIGLLRSGAVDAFAANGERLAELLTAVPEWRRVPGSVLAVRQAIALPKGRRAAREYLDAFLHRMRDRGTIEQLIAAHGIRDATPAATIGATR